MKSFLYDYIFIRYFWRLFQKDYSLNMNLIWSQHRKIALNFFSKMKHPSLQGKLMWARFYFLLVLTIPLVIMKNASIFEAI